MKNYPINDSLFLIKKTTKNCKDKYLKDLLISYHQNGFIKFRPKDPNFTKTLESIKKSLNPFFNSQLYANCASEYMFSSVGEPSLPLKPLYDIKR